LPNVKLVSFSTTSFELIDHSIAAATVSGTVGFEAVSRGKPVFLFGHAWYKGCEGVFYTPTQKLCEQSLSVIKNGYTVDTEKVRLFVYVLEKCGFEGYIDDIYEKMSSIPKLQNAQSIAAAIGNYAISKLNQK
jgi:capsule polysaccharide export protein KpsC/LpsZ